jgi:CDP-diacylglycerol--serine O-phosphatidyltransferase
MSVRNGLPSLVTVAGMGFGFFSILVAQDGAIDTALWLIFLAVLCDIADGKLARRLGATSVFGAQLDSFADAISFGVAPAVVLYEGALQVFGWLGACAAFFYATLAVFRLVRFNLDSGGRRRDVFRGLSTPGAALYLLSYLALRHELPAAVGGIYALGLGGLMVSSVPSPTFKGEGLSPAYLVVALANTLLLLLRPSWGTFLWWNAFSLFLLLRSYRVAMAPRAGGTGVE